MRRLSSNSWIQRGDAKCVPSLLTFVTGPIQQILNIWCWTLFRLSQVSHPSLGPINPQFLVCDGQVRRMRRPGDPLRTLRRYTG